MKKCMLIALITVFTLVSVGALCSADSRRGVANTSKLGSLLVFPLIKVSPASEEDGNDTIVTISNNGSVPVRMNCQYKTGKECNCTPFSFSLTQGQPISFSAKTGLGIDGKDISIYVLNVTALPTDNGQYVGELRCWAVDNTDTQNNVPISFNWLSGTATVYEGQDQTWEYSAWRFAVGYAVQDTYPVPNATGTSTGLLRLTGLPETYDTCPGTLVFTFPRQVVTPSNGAYSSRTDNVVTLIPCKQDCVTNPDTTIRASFTTYDQNEQNLHAYACFNCTDNSTAFYAKSLSGKTPSVSQIVNPSAFYSNNTPSYMAVVTSQLAGDGADCVGSIGATAEYGVPMLGVISNRFSSKDGPVAGETPSVQGRGQPTLTGPNGEDTGLEVIMTYRR